MDKQYLRIEIEVLGGELGEVKISSDALNDKVISLPEAEDDPAEILVERPEFLCWWDSLTKDEFNDYLSRVLSLRQDVDPETLDNVLPGEGI